MGRRRWQRSVLNGLHLIFAGLLFLIGKLHNEDTVLRYESDEHDDTDLAEYIHGLIGVVHKDQCAHQWQAERSASQSKDL